MPIQLQSKVRAQTYLRADRNDADVYYLRAYYGLSEKFPYEQLVCSDQHMKKIYFISREMSDFLYSDCFKNQLNIINLGVQVFQRNNSKVGSGAECIYRISQEGVINVLPYMSKRVVRSSNLTFFKKLISNRYNGWKELGLKTEGNSSEDRDQLIFDEIEALSCGCFVFVLEISEDGQKTNKIEPLVMHKFDYALSTMISKESAYNLQMRYLSQQEREVAQGILQDSNQKTSSELADCMQQQKEVEYILQAQK